MKKMFPLILTVMCSLFFFTAEVKVIATEEERVTQLAENSSTEYIDNESEIEDLPLVDTPVAPVPPESTTGVDHSQEEETTDAVAPVTVYMLGDVDSDGKVKAGDARGILRFSVSLNELESEKAPAADMNSDGTVTANDARMALRASVGLEEIITVEYTVLDIKEPSCSSEGEIIYSDSEKEACLKLSKRLHTFSVADKKDATCTKTGYVQKKCDACKVVQKETLSKLEHDFKIVKNVKPTCTTDGLEHTVCSLCNKENKEVLPKLNHNWQAATEKTPTTCTNCSLKKTGWEQVNGKYYYFKKVNNEVVLAVNCIVDNWYVDKTGVRVDDATVKAAVAFVNKYSKSTDDNKTRLKACFNVLCKFPYVSMYGKPTAADMPNCALYMFNNRQGNCYRYAAAFAYVARVLGFDSRVVLGKVLGTYGYMTAHSYTQVKIDGLWYICDGSKHGRYTSKNWYMVTQATYPNRYDVEKYTTFEIKNGKVYWS